MEFNYSGFGGKIVTNPNKTTTVIGKYNANGPGTKSLIDSGLTKSGVNLGGLNVLDDPNFSGWVTNKEWLDKAIARGDDIRLISDPNLADGFFSQEIEYLISKGYRVDGAFMINR